MVYMWWEKGCAHEPLSEYRCSSWNCRQTFAFLGVSLDDTSFVETVPCVAERSRHLIDLGSGFLHHLDDSGRQG